MASTFTDARLLSLDHFAAPAGEKSLLRISTAGSVDDGKSTLIGRLLFDTKTAWEDQLEELGRSKVNRASRGPDLSLLTDGLRAEREQGITIDVAYRYFSTPRRKFIVADTPGHEQYTRNMATGASTADVAIILLDARKGVLDQSRRHAFIAWLLGVRRLIFTVNKMDLVDFDEHVFDEIRAQAATLLALLEGARADFLPVSALDGDNVVTRSSRTPWYKGPCLLELLETIDLPARHTARPFRLPVQMVLRPHLDFRGYAGQIASGSVRVGDEVAVLPSGRRSVVKRIVTFDGDLQEAYAPMSVTLELEHEIDIARGDLLCAAEAQPRIARRVESMLVWMNDHPLEGRKTYLLQHGPRTVPARVERLLQRMDVTALKGVPAAGLALNEIGKVIIETAEPLVFDSYRDNRSTGGFVLIDPISNLTLAAGMVEAPVSRERRASRSVEFRASRMTAAERESVYGHRAVALDLSTRPELAPALERVLIGQGRRVLLIENADAPVGALLELGQIVLLTQPCAEARLDARGVSANGEEALLEMLERLRRARVFVDHDDVEPGEGI